MKELFGDLENYIYVTLLVGLVIALTNYILNLSKGKRDRLTKASGEFRQAFADEVHFLKHGPSANPLTETAHYVLKSALDRHRRAYGEFGDRLWRIQRNSFDRAWQDYLYPEGNHRQHRNPLVDYINDANEAEEIKIRKLALEKIRALLQFAKDT